MAELDLQAARAFILETHPAAVPETGDAAFLTALEEGYEEAQAFAGNARTFGAYRASLQRFAASLGDAHIHTGTWVAADLFWPGFAVSNRSGEWRVIASEGDGVPPAGALLLSCDGRNPDALAAERLGPFVSDWSVRAQRTRASSGLLLDRGNPLQPRLQACDVQTADGTSASHPLVWRRIDAAEIGRRLSATVRETGTDVGIRRFGEGWWIRLGTLSAAAVPLLREAAERRPELTGAPFVVVDLRGNGGGASFIADRLAELIYGPARVAAARRPPGSGTEETMIWRVSPVTLDTAQAYVERAVKGLPADDPILGGMIAQRDAMRSALAEDRPLAAAPAEVGVAEPIGNPRSAPQVFLVTDRLCFSSCLLAARLFRELGARHVGEETNANTRYSNVVTTELPSGLSDFQSLQSYSSWVPLQLGPYAPEIPLQIDLADDAQVEDQLRSLIGSR